MSVEKGKLSVQGLLTSYVQDTLLSDREGVALGSDDDLLVSGLLDSVAVMRLVAFIADRLEVEVPPEDVVIENFSTINVISDYVEKRLKPAG